MAQKKWLKKFGGHEQAAGLSLDKENLPALLEGLKLFNRENLTSDLLVQKLRLDKRLQSNEISHELLSDLELLEPYGLGNPRPMFRYDHLKVESARKIGKDSNHLKLMINENYRLLEALQFQYGDRLVPKKNARIDLAFQLELNHFNGVESIQLQIKDIRSYQPEASLFNKRLYVSYLTSLFEGLRRNVSMSFIQSFEGMKWTERKSDHIENLVKENAKINVFSYEGLIELSYVYHDLGLDIFKELEKNDSNIKVLPIDRSFDSINFDVAIINSMDQVKDNLSRSLDHKWMCDVIEDIYFDRAHFTSIYQKIRTENELDLPVFLLVSPNVLLDLVAINFFEEAGFITIANNRVTISKNKHTRVEFEQSNMNQKLVQMKNSFKKVHAAICASSEL
jgi:hypothetical protein